MTAMFVMAGGLLFYLAGEAFAITVSGVIYSDEGSTVYDCSGNTLTVGLRVSGAGSYTADCTANDGSYSITGVTINANNDVVSVFLNDETENANTITRAADTSSDIAGLHLYQDRVIVRHEGGTKIDSSNLNDFDNGNDSDMLFTVTTLGSPVVFEDGVKLIVWTGKTYDTGGTLTTSPSSSSSSVDGDILVQSSATLDMAGNALSVGGDFTVVGTFSYNSSNTTTFTATSTGFTIEDATSNFDKVVFNGSGGGWSFSSAVTLADDLTMTNGTLSGTNNITVNGGDVTGDGTINLTGGTFTLDTAGNFGGATAWTFNNLTFGDGTGATTSTATGAGGITVSSAMTIAANQTLSSGSKTYTLGGSGSAFVVNGTFTASTSTVNYIGSSATTVAGVTYNNLGVGTTSDTGAGVTYTLGGNATVSGTSTIGHASSTNNDTFSQGAAYNLTSGAITVTSRGTWDNVCTGDVTLSGDVSNSGSVTLDANGLGCVDADDITLTSTDTTQRTWSGAGTFALSDLVVSYMAGTMTAYSSTDNGNNAWTFEECDAATMFLTFF